MSKIKNLYDKQKARLGHFQHHQSCEVVFSSPDGKKKCIVTIQQNNDTTPAVSQIGMRWDPDPEPNTLPELYAAYALHFFKSIGGSM